MSWILLFGFGALGLVAWVVRPRRRKQKPVVPWVPDKPEEVRLESYEQQLLRELGLPYGIDADRRPPR